MSRVIKLNRLFFPGDKVIQKLPPNYSSHFPSYIIALVRRATETSIYLEPYESLSGRQIPSEGKLTKFPVKYAQDAILPFSEANLRVTRHLEKLNESVYSLFDMYRDQKISEIVTNYESMKEPD